MFRLIYQLIPFFPFPYTDFSFSVKCLHQIRQFVKEKEKCDEKFVKNKFLTFCNELIVSKIIFPIPSDEPDKCSHYAHTSYNVGKRVRER